MPAAPEFRDGSGNVRIVEVFQELEAEHFAQADGHVGVAGEVKQDLQGIKNRPQPGGTEGQIALRNGAEAGVRPQGQRICQQDLFPKSINKPQDALVKAVQCLLPVADLPGNGLIADNGPGDELWKQCNVQSHIERIFLRFAFAPVHVQHIGHGLERIKGNAHRQRDLRNADV